MHPHHAGMISEGHHRNHTTKSDTKVMKNIATPEKLEKEHVTKRKIVDIDILSTQYQ